MDLALLAAVICAHVPSNAQTAPAPRARKVSILTLNPTATPRVENGVMIYTLDIVFDTRPDVFWAFFDRAQRRLRIELFDTELETANIALPPRLPYGDLTADNTRSKKSLTGSHAVLSLMIDDDWHYECLPVDNSTIQIRLWKALKQEAARKRKAPVALLYSLLGVGAAALSFTIVLLVVVNK